MLLLFNFVQGSFFLEIVDSASDFGFLDFREAMNSVCCSFKLWIKSYRRTRVVFAGKKKSLL